MLTRKIDLPESHTWTKGFVPLRAFAAVIAAGFVLLALTVVPVSADSPTVTVLEYTVNPSVLMPDSLGTITIVIKNTASTASVSEKSGQLSGVDFSTVKTTDINVNIENIHLEGNGLGVITKDFARVGEIGPGQSIPITFSISAPSKSGMYYPEVWIDTSGGTSTKYPIPVNVNTAIGIQKEAILIMDTTVSGNANPGDDIPVALTVRNAGQTLADDVILKFETQNSTVAPKNADFVHLGNINPGDQKTADLVLLSDKLTAAGLVRVPVLVSYNGIDGTPHNLTTGIDLMMKGKAELGFVSVDTNPTRLTENTPFDLTVRIENTGTGEAKQVSAKVDLPAEGTKEAFIGKIKPGNDAPAIFLLEGMKSGNYPYTLTITYTDDMGVHTQERQLNARVPVADSSGTIIFGLLIIGIIGFLAYRYWYLPKKNGNGSFPWERKN